ncbi:hypothetical protein [Deferrisoma camini]|nr:hypothetical protein [Deferrisoma camini]
MKRIAALTVLLALLGITGVSLAAPAASACGCSSAQQTTTNLEATDLVR